MTENNLVGVRFDFKKSSSVICKIEDLVTLQSLRNPVEINAEMMYKMMLLFISLDVKIGKDMNSVLKDALLYNSKFCIGIDFVEITNMVVKAFKQESQIPSNLKIIKSLVITPEEQKQMQILITKIEKNRRGNDKRSRTAKVHKFIRTDFTKKRIQGLITAGKTVDEIAVEIGKSKRTVYRYLKDQ